MPGWRRGDVLGGDRARRARAQLADRRARRGALLLPPHDAARDPGRPRAALLRARADRPGAAAGAALPGRRAPARARASVRRAAALGVRPLHLARAVFLRRGTASRLDPRVRAFLLLHGGLPDVGAGARDAAGAGVVRHRDEVRLHRRGAPARDDPRQHLHLVVERVLHRVSPRAGVGDHAGPRPEPRRRRDDGRGLARHRGHPRLAVLAARRTRASCGRQLLEQGLDPRQVRRAVRYGRADELVKPSRT